MSLREFSGNAKPTSLSADITSASTSLSIADPTGWPTGSTAPFVATIDRGTASEEKVLVTSRSSNTLTGVVRGYDGTTATAHLATATVEHTGSAVDFREANTHVNDITGDPHPQYLTPAEAAAAYLTPAAASGLYLALAAAQSGTVNTSESTTSTTYAALATAGPAATVTIGASGRALVIIGAALQNSGVGGESDVNFAISGATTQAAAAGNFERRLTFQSAVSNQYLRMSRVSLVTGLNAGSTTFTLMYKVTSGTGTFDGRHIVVIPL